jgi:cyclohexanecarboxyl-CoA dehydrogenase
MDFRWTAEQQALRDSVARFARQQVAPVSASIDADGAIPPDLLAALAKLGLLSMGLPVELDGSGASSVDLGIVVEELTLISLAAVGAGRAAIADASDYAQDRVSMGVPIIQHQGVSSVLAENATKLEAARWLWYRVLWLRDAGEPHTTEAAMCKWWAVQTAVDAIHDAMLLHGHAGYTRELSAQQRFRDVIGMEWGDGTAQIQKMVIARSLLRR